MVLAESHISRNHQSMGQSLAFEVGDSGAISEFPHSKKEVEEDFNAEEKFKLYQEQIKKNFIQTPQISEDPLSEFKRKEGMVSLGIDPQDLVASMQSLNDSPEVK